MLSSYATVAKGGIGAETHGQRAERPRRASKRRLRRRGTHRSPGLEAAVGGRAAIIVGGAVGNNTSGSAHSVVRARIEALAREVRERGADVYALTFLVGYALFRVVQSLSYSTGMSTSSVGHPLNDNLPYAFVSSLAMVACCVALACSAWKRPALKMTSVAVASLVAMPCINLCFALGLSAALPDAAVAVVLPAVGGALSALASIAWLVPLVGMRPRRGLVAFVFALLASAALVAALGMLPPLPRAACLMAAGLGSAVALVRLGRLSGSADDAGDDPLAGMSQRRRLLGSLDELWSPLVVTASLNTVLSLVTAFQVAGTPGMTGGPLLRNLALVAADTCMVLLALFGDSMFSIRRIFRRCFPAMALLLVVLPFMGHAYGLAFNAALVMLNGIVSACALFMVVESARAWRLPVVTMGPLMMAVAQGLVAVTLMAARALHVQEHMDQTVQGLVLVLVSLYLLSMALFSPARFARRRVGEAPGVALDDLGELLGPQGSRVRDEASDIGSSTSTLRGNARGINDVTGAGAESKGTVRHASNESKATGPLSEAARDQGFAKLARTRRISDVSIASTREGVSRPLFPAPSNRTASKAAAPVVPLPYGAERLTPREEQVMRLLARGRSASYVAQELGLSTNTVRGYVQAIYAKLGVHSKQELIDLVEGDR